MLDLKIDTQFMQAHTLSFKLAAEDDKVQYLAEDQEMEFDDLTYFVDSIETYREGVETFVEVKCNAIWYRLGERVYSGVFSIDGKTPEEGLLQILEAALTYGGLSWDIGQQPVNDATYSMDATDASYLDLLYQWAKVTSHEIDFDSANRLVLMTRGIGGGQVISFRYRRNLASVHRVVLPPQVTRIYPYGRDDLGISAITGEEYLEDYSHYTAQGMTEVDARARYRKDEVYKDDTFIDDQSLYRAASARLTVLAQPTISYTAKVIDLSALTGYDESHFRMGDSVVVEDEPLGIQVVARIVRYVRYPYEPHRNEVELSFIPVAVPDSRVSNNRSTSGTQWDLFVSYNTRTPFSVRSAHTILHRLPLRTRETAEWLVNLTIHGTGVGDCNLVIQAFDTVDDSNFWPLATIPVTDGELIRYGFSFGLKEVPTGLHGLSIRAYSDTGGCGIDVEQLASAFSVLARGTTQETITFDNSILYSYTGAVQSFQVPDDVYIIKINAVGAKGGTRNSVQEGGQGGSVTATFNVTPGTLYDVYVGGRPRPTVANSTGGWPNGGDGDQAASNIGTGGGGSSDVRLTGASFADTLIVAAGGGGGGYGFVSEHCNGGYGGYLLGGDGEGLSPGYGATQTAGGAGGINAPAGTPGIFGEGGDAGNTTNAFGGPGGGGGGGWYGGGGAGGGATAGLHMGGGGGASGMVNSFAYDIETTDDYNPYDGYVVISWDDPTI